MPGFIWAFILISGLAHGHTLLTEPGLHPHNDTPHMKGKTSTKVEYLAWSAPRWDAVEGPGGKCHVTLFALTTRQEPRRLVVNGKEKVIDFSWKWDETIPPGKQLVQPVVFIHPVTREETRREIRVNCWAAPPKEGR